MGDKDKPTCRIAQPINNENPVFIPIFAFRLQQWLYAKYPHMRRFIEYGIDITARNEVLVWDATHGIRHSVLKNNSPPCSFALPFQPYPTPHLSAALLGKFGTDATVAHPTSSPDRSGASTMTVKELPTDLPAVLSRFTIFPDGLRKLDQELFELCASCYESPSSRETLDELCSSSGLIYLKHLQGQIKLMGPEAHKKLALMMDEHFKAGLESPEIKSFHLYVTLGDAFNGSVKSSSRRTDDVILADHVRAVRDLGDYTAIQVDIKLAQSEQLFRVTKVEGKLPDEDDAHN